MATLKVFIRGKGAVTLSEEHDYVADGGEGRIYAKGDVVYKIYLDPGYMIPEAKIAELAALDHPNIVRPKDVLLDHKNRPIGFTMERVDGTELCRLFNTVFLNSNNIAPEQLLKLVEHIQEITQFIHDHKCLIVDGNELNYLVDAQDYACPYFIDVNSYQTPGFPASAINVFFADPHAKTFSTLTDWFTFGIVACKIFVGVHPYKGTHPNYGKKDVLKRMQANVSIFNPDTRIPVAARDFSYIPSAYYEWFVKIFEKGKRIPPPHVAGLLKVVAVTTQLIQSTGNFIITQFKVYDEPILAHRAVHGRHIVHTQGALYIDRARYTGDIASGDIVFTPKSLTPLSVRVDQVNNRLLISDINGTPLDLDLHVTRKPLVIDNTIYAVHEGDMTEIAIHELSGKPMASVTNVWKIMPKSSQIFDNMIFQTVLGKAYIVIPYHRSGKSYCAVKHIAELDEYRIIHGKHDNRVCMFIGVKDHLYHRLILRFDEYYDRYDLRVVEDIDYPSLNFVTLDNGVVVSIDEHAAVEMFSHKVGSGTIKRIEDPDITGTMLLSKEGTQVFCHTEKTLYTLKMR
jgi:hypothetical protein